MTGKQNKTILAGKIWPFRDGWQLYCQEWVIIKNIIKAKSNNKPHRQTDRHTHQKQKNGTIKKIIKKGKPFQFPEKEFCPGEVKKKEKRHEMIKPFFPIF